MSSRKASTYAVIAALIVGSQAVETMNWSPPAVEALSWTKH